MWLSRNRVLLKTNVSTNWLVTFWYNYYSLATVHPFLYVHIGFWILRIVIRPNWNNYHNITNAPTSFHLSQIKRISGSHYLLLLFTNSALQHVPVPNYISLLECKLVYSVLRHVDIGRIYSSITQSFKFDWSIYRSCRHVRLLRNQIYLNRH